MAETLLYITLFLLLVWTTSLAVLNRIGNDRSLEMATEELVYQMKRIQLLAIHGGVYDDRYVYYRIAFEKDGYYFPVYNEKRKPAYHKVQLPSHIVCENDYETRMFDGHGLPTDKRSIYLRHTETGERTKIMIVPHTGRIRWSRL